MRKPMMALAALLSMAGSAFADSFRVRFDIRGSGRDVTM